MKKLLMLVALSCIFCNVVKAATLDEKIAKVEMRYENRIEKLDNSRYKADRKALLKEHARQDADLKIKHLKELNGLKKHK